MSRYIRLAENRVLLLCRSYSVLRSRARSTVPIPTLPRHACSPKGHGKPAEATSPEARVAVRSAYLDNRALWSGPNPPNPSSAAGASRCSLAGRLGRSRATKDVVATLTQGGGLLGQGCSS